MKNLAALAALVVVALMAVLFASAPANAQTSCGPGTTYNPAYSPTGGQPICIPITDWSPPPSAPQGRWATRWGAFADDEATGKVGMAGSMSSKSKAVKAAIAHCQAKGGVDCRLRISYYNQCAVAAAGEHDDGTWNRAFQSAATLDEATDLALDWCRKDGAKDCKVYFSDCSNAEWVE
ncbi:MAG: DUF4189 domain-containing protein [Sphingopyxis sp.]|nr:DUF4189 domain-containing protein [Sphingopyxis sp.]